VQEKEKKKKSLYSLDPSQQASFTPAMSSLSVWAVMM